MNARHLATGRAAAHALFRATWDKNNKTAQPAAACLLELAVYSVSLVADSALVHPDEFHEASKDYPWFPILLASKNGRDTKQKLRRIESLPIGENRPFKKIRGPARNDDLWRVIESNYDQFERLRRSNNPDSVLVDWITPEWLQEIRGLPDLCINTAREWAGVMAGYLVAGPGGTELLPLLSINSAKETGKKARRKENRLRMKFGGTELETDQNGGEARYYVRTASANRGEELDPINATKLGHRSAAALNMQSTEADSVNAFTDAIEKRLLSRLKK